VGAEDDAQCAKLPRFAVVIDSWFRCVFEMCVDRGGSRGEGSLALSGSGMK
jgi:hypothetical protein